MKFLTLWFCLIGFFYSSKLQAQDTNKVQTFRIYSGEYCMFPQRDCFLSCEDAVNYGFTMKQIQSVQRMSELVMFENQEFWLVQNSMYVQHKDSLLYFTGTWKADGALFKFSFDSIVKPLKHFRKVGYRPAYFKKPIVRNYCALQRFGGFLPYSHHQFPRDFSLWGTGSWKGYSPQIIYCDSVCKAEIPKYLEIFSHTDTLEISWYMVGDADKLYGQVDAVPTIKIPLIYSKPIKIRQRLGETEIKN